MSRQEARQILGLDHGATKHQIRARYRELVLEWHPDRHTADSQKRIAEEKIKRINLAYEVLKEGDEDFAPPPAEEPISPEEPTTHQEPEPRPRRIWIDWPVVREKTVSALSGLAALLVTFGWIPLLAILGPAPDSSEDTEIDEPYISRVARTDQNEDPPTTPAEEEEEEEQPPLYDEPSWFDDEDLPPEDLDPFYDDFEDDLEP